MTNSNILFITRTYGIVFINYVNKFATVNYKNAIEKHIFFAIYCPVNTESDPKFIAKKVINWQFWSNGAGLVLLFYLSALLAGALLAPPMFFATKYLAEIDNSGMFSRFIGKGFGKFFDRAIMVSCLLLLWPFLKLSRTKLMDKNLFTGGLSNFFLFFSYGIGTVCIVLVPLWIISQLKVSHATFHTPGITLSESVYVVAKLVVQAIRATGLSFFEEIIFRGIILKLFRVSFGVVVSVVLSSLFFAYCHGGAASVVKIDHSDVTIFSGLKCIIPLLLSISHNFHTTSFFNLLLFGAILSILFLRHGSLLIPIAFHAGVVFAIKSLRLFSSDLPLPSETTKLSPATAIVIQCILILLLTRRAHHTQATE
ncbi:MAG: CPBP family intramembrane metalloprotease [Puniceicoccales bacterium]|jgi:membrane protease YdiL (CAAX protease family)|nr:CPBP family intramembrane metalloprotease [Puniceicoccales bacterium]